MKVKKEKNNDSEIFDSVETIETTPSDGLVHEADITPLGVSSYGHHQYGYSKRKVYTITNLKYVKPIAYGICSIFLIVALILLLCKLYIFGIIFMGVGLYSILIVRRDLNKKNNIDEKK